MLYLENKLHLFRKIVYEKRAEANLEELESLNRQCEKEYEKRKLELETQRDEMILRRKKLAENRYNQEMARLDEEDRIVRLRKDEELLEDLLQGLK
ncbi:MAG: hypothetical protein Q4Q07_08300, partial [Tissierellia bacterium]|nr:hypothetical protein [Tissierellia bacterium]